jgi:signal transduction histidine kinase
MKDLVEDMVNLTNLDAGGAELDLVEFSMQSLVSECIQTQLDLAETKSLEIRASLPDAEVRVRADREKIGIALNNLLDNAIKFTPTGGHIEVSVRSRDNAVAVSVTDSGIGIPKGEADQIFERFHQVESHLTRSQGGMGLGLSIARGMIQLHGGRIWVESTEGHGSTFTFILPIPWKAPASQEAR